MICICCRIKGIGRKLQWYIKWYDWDSGVKKEIGFSSADVGDTDDSSSLHGFLSDGKTHKQWEKIYKLAESLGSGMKLILKAGEDVALKV